MSIESPENASPPLPRPGIRWWPALLILALALVRGGVIWFGEASQLQDRVVPTMALVGFTLIGLLFWLFLFSRLPWPTRGRLFLAVAGISLLTAALVRVDGFSGDLIPDVRWRWSGGGDLAQATGTGDAAAIAPTDFPQFLGPRRDARIDGVALARDWQTQPPRELWRRQVGDAWSAFAVVGSAAITQEKRAEDEAVVRYDLESGEPVWSTVYPGFFDTMIGGSGPRATPTVHDGRVYAYGSTGVLVALDLRDGSLLWQRDTKEESGATLPEWGYAGSPLVYGDLVIVAPGGPDGQSVAAYDLATGEPRWSGGDDPATYASPMVATLLGEPQVVVRNIGSVTGHDPTDGRVLWIAPWPGLQPNVAQPMVIGDDRLLISSGYGIGSTLFRLSRDAEGGWTAEEVWQSLRLKAKFANPVQLGGKIYGLDDGVMVCLDPESGERCWKRGRYGHGQVLLVGDLLLVQSEKGELILIEPNPDELRELARIEVLEGKSWNTFALAGRHLLVRNAGEAACYELPLAG